MYLTDSTTTRCSNIFGFCFVLDRKRYQTPSDRQGGLPSRTYHDDPVVLFVSTERNKRDCLYFRLFRLFRKKKTLCPNNVTADFSNRSRNSRIYDGRHITRERQESYFCFLSSIFLVGNSGNCPKKSDRRFRLKSPVSNDPDSRTMHAGRSCVRGLTHQATKAGCPWVCKRPFLCVNCQGYFSCL